MTAEKPSIPDSFVAKWQRIVDLLAQVMTVPAGLVMRAQPPQHVVFVASANDGNPYVPSQAFRLHTGLYCDAVMDHRRELLVRNAHVEPEWKANPDLKHDMSFYLGFPLCWPDGTIFGTICVLDSTENAKAVEYRDLLAEFRNVIDGDLALVVEMSERKRLAKELKQSHEKLEWRVEVRTHELRDANRALRDREGELEDVNTALRVLLNRVERSRAELEDQVVRNLNELIVPQIEKLKHLAATSELRVCLSLLDTSVRRIASSYSSNLSARFAGLTFTEIEIALLVTQGLNSKQIAKTLSRATSTVDFHRNNIRKKLGIEDRSLSLRSFLVSSTHMGNSPISGRGTSDIGPSGQP